MRRYKSSRQSSRRPASRPARLGSLALLATLAAALPASGETISIQGSTTFSSRLIEPYRAEIEARAGRRLDVIANKSIHGLVALLEGRTQLAMISSDLEGERALLRFTHPSLPAERLRSFEVARTRIAFVVHPANPVRRAKLGEIARVLRGEVRSWAEIGGSDIAVTVVTVQPGGGVPTTVRGQLLGGKAMTPARIVQVEASSHVVRIAAQIEGALGIAQLGLVPAATVAELETDARVEQELNLVTLGEPDAGTLAVIEAARQVAAASLF